MCTYVVRTTEHHWNAPCSATCRSCGADAPRLLSDHRANYRSGGMTRETNSPSAEQSTRRSPDQSSASDQPDRERSIRTDREAGRSSGVARRSRTTPVFGSTASPFGMMRRMAEDMDRLFGNFGFGLQPAAWAPQVETFRRGDQLVVRADLPGMKKDDVNVEVEDGVLTISGERCDEH